MRVGTCVILVHSASVPADSEWLEYLAFLEQHNRDKMRILVVSDGGAPTASQRAKLKLVADRFPDRALPTAVLTASVVARGVVTALEWFFKNSLQAFGPTQLPEALAYLNVPHAFHAQIKQSVRVLRERLRE